MHRHTWKIRDKSEQPSMAEIAATVGQQITSGRAHSYQLAPVYRRDVIVSYHCDCGAEKVERV